jgi:Uma2 family endonuclease
MPPATATAPRTESVPLSPVYRFTVEQFQRMIEAGLFRSDDRVELLEGCVVTKVTQNPPHAGTFWFLLTALAARLGEDWVLRIQNPIITQDSQPEPDGAIVRGPAVPYLTSHPTASAVTLVIEISDSTLEEDRTTKARIYARARIPTYWIINLVDSQIEVYTDPRAGKNPAYRQRQDYRRGQSVPLILGGQALEPIPVQELLP